MHNSEAGIRVYLMVSVVLFANAAGADPVPLTAGEIEILLAGNTALGDWQGDTYRQYFATDGATIYAVEGRRSARGRRADLDGQ